MGSPPLLKKKIIIIKIKIMLGLLLHALQCLTAEFFFAIDSLHDISYAFGEAWIQASKQ